MNIISRTVREVTEVLDDADLIPSDKRAAVTMIELRTKLEVRSLFLKVSLGLNMTFATSFLIHFLLGP